MEEPATVEDNNGAADGTDDWLRLMERAPAFTPVSSTTTLSANDPAGSVALSSSCWTIENEPKVYRWNQGRQGSCEEEKKDHKITCSMSHLIL